MSEQHHPTNFIESVVGHDYGALTTAAVVAVSIATLGFLAKRSLEKSSQPLIPDAGMTSRNFFELIAQFIMNLSDNVMGKENRRFLPFVGSLFVYIAGMNLIGLLPGFHMPTDRVPVNLGLGLTVFIVYNYLGIREVGLGNYLKHFWGPLWVPNPLWLVGLMVFLIELVSHVVRPLSLSLRLQGNMMGDHLVLGAFTDLTKFGIPIIFYFLGTFVCLMQAFVFTLLTMIYIRFAVAHEEHEEGHEGNHAH